MNPVTVEQPEKPAPVVEELQAVRLMSSAWRGPPVQLGDVGSNRLNVIVPVAVLAGTGNNVMVVPTSAAWSWSVVTPTVPLAGLVAVVRSGNEMSDVPTPAPVSPVVGSRAPAPAWAVVCLPLRVESESVTGSALLLVTLNVKSMMHCLTARAAVAGPTVKVT